MKNKFLFMMLTAGLMLSLNACSFGKAQVEEPSVENQPSEENQQTYNPEMEADNMSGVTGREFRSAGLVVKTDSEVTMTLNALGEEGFEMFFHGGAGNVAFTVDGLKAASPYYQYVNDYSNKTTLTTDSNGSVTFMLDLNQAGYVTIQFVPGTIILTETGGACSTVGTWDAGTKTCTLTQDLTESVQLAGNVTLDCDNHKIIGPEGTFSGVFLPQPATNTTLTKMTVKNCEISGFFRGILSNGGQGNIITNNTIHSVVNGIGVFSASAGTTWFPSIDNTISNNEVFDVTPTLTQSIMGDWVDVNGGIGILDVSGLRNKFIGNTVRDSWAGLQISGIVTVFPNNASGSERAGETVVQNNTLNNNRENFRLFFLTFIQNPLGDADITIRKMKSLDVQNNTVDGKDLVFLKNASGTVIDSSSNAGVVYCISCENIEIKDLDLKNNQNGVVLFDTKNATVTNVRSTNLTADPKASGFANGPEFIVHGGSGNVFESNFSLSNAKFHTAIHIEGSSNNVFNGNTIIGSGVGTNGVFSRNRLNSSKPSLNNTFTSNSFDVGGQAANFRLDSHQVVFTDNTVTRAAQAFVSAQTNGHVIERNTFTGTGATAIEGGSNIILRENVIKDGKIVTNEWNGCPCVRFPIQNPPTYTPIQRSPALEMGLRVLNASNITIERNVITNMIGTGLFLQNATNAIVTRNDIYKNAESGVNSNGVAIYEVSSNTARFLDNAGLGNYWGRHCGQGQGTDGPPLFQPGIDSNRTDVVDRYPFGHTVSKIEAVAGLRPMACPTNPTK